MRAFLIVLDSVGIGYAPDAREYGDEGAATLPHIAPRSAASRCPPWSPSASATSSP
jgi:phosphopentomutase